MAKKEYKVWLDIYKDNIVIAPYELQTYKYVKPFFSRGDMYGNIFYIEIQKNGTKYNLTTENVAVQYYIDGQCAPMYTQVESSLLRIEDGAIVLELDPAVFAFVGDVHAQVLISNGSEKISCPEISFEVQRGSADYLPADNVYQVVVVYLTQAEYNAMQSAGTLEAGKLYIITDEVGTPYYQIYHNSLTGLQGGASNEQFHLTQAQHTALTSIEKVIKIGNDGVATAANTVDITTPSYGIATGTNDYAIILDPAPEAYVAGMMVSFFAQNSNDSDCTLNINGLGIKPIKKNIDQEIPFNSIKAGQIVTVLYDGTNFQLISGSGSGGIAIPLYSTNTLSVESNTATIGIDFFDKNKDILLVYQNSTFISVGNDYIVSEDNLTIEKTTGTWAIGTVIDFVCFQMVDANPDILGITKIESSFTAIADNTTHIPMNTSNYNTVNDVLYVYYQNLLIFENLDYTVNIDGVSIDLIGFDIDIGEVINFQILKKVRQSLDTTDGTLIQDGTVGNAKLATDIKIGSLASLTTDNKTTVVGAINEIDNNLNLVLPISSGAGFHNSIFRGKYLGSVVTTEQYNAISAGTFDDLYIGDYWTIGGVNYRIACFNYYYNTGENALVALTTNHAVIVPDTVLYNYVMNDTETTTGAYVGSKMYVSGLNSAKTTINNAFSGHVVGHRNYLHNAVTSGYTSGGSWYDSTVELMTEANVYGTKHFGNAAQGTNIANNSYVDKSQFPLFALNPQSINTRETYWLRDVSSSTTFARVYTIGTAGYGSAVDSEGVRPAFCIS